MAMIQRDNYTRRFKRNSNHITFTNSQSTKRKQTGKGSENQTGLEMEINNFLITRAVHLMQSTEMHCKFAITVFSYSALGYDYFNSIKLNVQSEHCSKHF